MADTQHISGNEAQQASPPQNSTEHGTIILPDGKSGIKRRSTSQISIFSEEELKTVDFDLSTDVSLEFRRSLEKRSSRYRIEKMLASGGFGQIFLAEDKILGRKVVIKTLKDEHLKKEDSIAHFIAEAKLSAQLEHPSIVPMYSLNTDAGDGLHVAMQLINGITLAEYLARSLKALQEKKVSQSQFNKLLRERLEMFVHICDAVSYCHNRHIIHNDLKPENIMIANFGQVYIMDWGIASIDGQQKKRNISGSLSYIAPEKFSTHVCNKQTDIFSLGMILNEIVTLRGPVSGENSTAIINKICRGEFEPSTCVIPKYRIPESLRAIIEKARCAAPVDRYYNVARLADDVRHFLFHEEIKAYPDTVVQKVARFLFQHRVVCLWVTLSVILAAAGVALFSYDRQNQVIREMSERMLRYQNMQNEVDKHAVEFARRVVLLQEQSRSLCDTLTYEMRQPSSGSPVPIYTVKDFAPGSKKQIPGLVHSPYYHAPATLEHGTWYLFNKKLGTSQLQKLAECFQALHSQRLSAMALNINNEKADMRKNRRKHFYQSGSLIRRMIFSLDNGVVFTYPGMYEPVSAQEDFFSEYIRREKRTGQQLLWAPPYIDKSGQAVFACWRTIYDPQGKNTGILGFELSAFELIQAIESMVGGDKTNSFFAMVDSEERLIYSSGKGKLWRQAGQNPEILKELISDDSYHYPVVLRQIRKHRKSTSFDIVLSGKPYRIFWARIPFANWVLIQHYPIPEKKIDPASFSGRPSGSAGR